MFLHNAGPIFFIFVGGPLLEARFFGKFAWKIGIFGIQTGEFGLLVQGPLIEILRYIVKVWGYKTFFMLNSAEHEISTIHKN